MVHDLYNTGYCVELTVPLCTKRAVKIKKNPKFELRSTFYASMTMYYAYQNIHFVKYLPLFWYNKKWHFKNRKFLEFSVQLACTWYARPLTGIAYRYVQVVPGENSYLVFDRVRANIHKIT